MEKINPWSFLQQSAAAPAMLADMLKEIGFNCECGGRVLLSTKVADLPAQFTGVPCSGCDRTYTVDIGS